jgi:hypothetical protein
MDDDWTWHVRSYIAQLRDAEFMPPINGVHVEERRGRSILCVDVPTSPSEDFRVRVGAVLASVPHEIRHVPFSEDGSRPGVSYI